MKHVVSRRFTDKETGELRLPGDPYEGSEERIAFLLHYGYIKPLEFTKNQIMDLLALKGIEYRKTMRKAELESLLGGD